MSIVWRGCDCETYLIVPGRLVPRLVCVTLAGHGDPPDVLPPPDTVHNMVVGPGSTATSPTAVVATAQRGWTALLDATVGVTVVRTLLADPNAGLVFHNAPFDLAVLMEAEPALVPLVFAALDAGRIRDTMTREQLLAIAEDRYEFDPVTGKPPRWHLAELVQRYFGVDISATKVATVGADGVAHEPWRLRYNELDGVPVDQWPQAAVDYAVEDASWALSVHDAQGADDRLGGAQYPLVAGGHVTNEDEQVRAALALHLMGCWGLRTDQPRVDAFVADTDRRVLEGQAVATAAGFLRPPKVTRHRDGTTSEKRSVDTKVLRSLVEAAYKDRGGPPMTAGGSSERAKGPQVSTSRDTLLESGDARLIAYAGLGIYKKYKSTYVPALIAGAGHAINHGYRCLGARSGRTSAVPGWTQQPPRNGGFRGCFVPRPGHVFCSVDFNMAELVALGQVQLWLFERSALATALNKGLDVHLVVAADLLGLSYDEVKAISKAGPTHPRYDDVAGPQGGRQMGKIVNFGAAGGLTAKSMIDYARAYGVRLGLARAEEILQTWHRTWPEMQMGFDVVADQCESGGGTFTQLTPQSWRQRGGVRWTVGCNGLFQPLVADFAKAALFAVTRAAYSDPTDVLYGARPVLFVHDEVIAELPEDRAGMMGDRMCELMLEAARPYVPDMLLTAEPALMRRWSKGAKTVRDADGRLLVWEDPNDVADDEGDDVVLLDETAEDDAEEVTA